MFYPCKYKNHHFLDGGILDNIPVTEVKKQGADIIISVNFELEEVNEDSNIIDITMRTLDIMGSKVSENSLNYTDYLITIEACKVGLLDFTKLETCYQCGYETAIKAIKGKLGEILQTIC